MVPVVDLSTDSAKKSFFFVGTATQVTLNLQRSITTKVRHHQLSSMILSQVRHRPQRWEKMCVNVGMGWEQLGRRWDGKQSERGWTVGRETVGTGIRRLTTG